MTRNLALSRVRKRNPLQHFEAQKPTISMANTAVTGVAGLGTISLSRIRGIHVYIITMYNTPSLYTLLAYMRFIYPLHPLQPVTNKGFQMVRSVTSRHWFPDSEHNL